MVNHLQIQGQHPRPTKYCPLHRPQSYENYIFQCFGPKLKKMKGWVWFDISSVGRKLLKFCTLETRRFSTRILCNAFGFTIFLISAMTQHDSQHTWDLFETVRDGWMDIAMFRLRLRVRVRAKGYLRWRNGRLDWLHAAKLTYHYVHIEL